MQSLAENDYPIENIRRRGTIVAFDIKNDQETSYFNEIRDTAYDFFMSKGVLLRPLGNVIYILPPYTFGEEELNQTYSAIHAFLGKLKG